MSFLDKAKDLIGQHSDKIDEGIEKVSDVVSDKLPGQADKIEQAKDFIQDKIGDGDAKA